MKEKKDDFDWVPLILLMVVMVLLLVMQIVVFMDFRNFTFPRLPR